MAVADVLTGFAESALALGAALWPGSGLVSVARTDPDTGSVTATAAGVRAVWRDRTAAVVTTEAGGEVRVETCRFRFAAADCPAFAPRKRDTVTEADGTVWDVEDCRTVGLTGVRYVLDCVRVNPG